MPYINRRRRTEIDDGQSPQTPGDLSYVFTAAIIKYIDTHSAVPRAGPRKVTSQIISDICGAWKMTETEFIRQLVIPFEEGKRLENGDLY